MPLSPLREKFVLHWGEMGSRWGVNRTIGQIHALLYLSERPLTAEEICDALSLARSNVSTSLRELQGWGLVRTTHLMGDRRDHFEAQKDIWDIFRSVVEERRRRELEPTVSMLRNALLDAPVTEDDQRVQARMREVLDLLELGTAWMDEMRRLPPETLLKIIKLGAGVQRFVRGEANAAPPERWADVGPPPPATPSHED